MPRKSSSISESVDAHVAKADVPPERDAMLKYIGRTKAEMAVKRKAALEERGYKDFYSFPEGQTSFILAPLIPREREGNFGKQAIFRICVDMEERDFSVNMTNPVFRQLIEVLDKAPVDLKMLRVGTGKQTKMKVLE